MNTSNGIIINVRGCNASGKTTCVREYIKTFDNPQIVTVDNNVFTQCSDDVYVLGRYDKKNGGCDGYKGREHVISAISVLIKQKRPKAIIYEGMIYSKSYKMAHDVETLFKPNGYAWHGIYMHSNFSSILKRLEQRNGGAEYNVLNVYNTYMSALNSYKNIKNSGMNIRMIDVDKIPFEKMSNILTEETHSILRG